MEYEDDCDTLELFTKAGKMIDGTKNQREKQDHPGHDIVKIQIKVLRPVETSCQSEFTQKCHLKLVLKSLIEKKLLSL